MHDFAKASGADDDFVDWVASTVAFPNTMVDRIVPATTSADRGDALRLLGVVDEGLVVAEPFSQWVIEDRFAGPHPAWGAAGALVTDAVDRYDSRSAGRDGR